MQRWGRVKVGYDWTRLVLWLLPLTVAAVLLKPVLGFVGNGIAGGVPAWMAMRLEVA